MVSSVCTPHKCWSIDALAALNVYGIAIALMGSARIHGFPIARKTTVRFLSDGNYPRWVLLKLNNFAASSLARRLLIGLLQ